MNTAQKLATFDLTDADGNATRLGTLWSEAPAVVAFVRHFG